MRSTLAGLDDGAAQKCYICMHAALQVLVMRDGSGVVSFNTTDCLSADQVRNQCARSCPYLSRMFTLLQFPPCHE